MSVVGNLSSVRPGVGDHCATFLSLFPSLHELLSGSPAVLVCSGCHNKML